MGLLLFMSSKSLNIYISSNNRLFILLVKIVILFT